MSAREELVSIASQDMPVSGEDVNRAINAFALELLGGDPACSAGYLRARFAEAIWESPLAEHVDPSVWDAAVDALVERLLGEMGAE